MCWRVLLLFHMFVFLWDFSIFVYIFKCFVCIHKRKVTLLFPTGSAVDLSSVPCEHLH